MLGRRRTASWLPALAAALCLSAAAAPADAQEQGFALGRFTPAPAGDRMFGVQSPYTAGHLDVHVQLLGDYAHNPLVAPHVLGRGEVAIEEQPHGAQHSGRFPKKLTHACRTSGVSFVVSLEPV